MAPATHRAVRSANNLLTATPDEAAIIIACALTDPRDLLALAVAYGRPPAEQRRPAVLATQSCRHHPEPPAVLKHGHAALVEVEEQANTIASLPRGLHPPPIAPTSCGCCACSTSEHSDHSNT
jgi:hypothetical protein